MSQSASPNRVPSFDWPDQDNLLRFTKGYETLAQGMFNIAVQQVELTRGLIEGGLADYALLADAHTPDALLRAEVELFRRSSERAFEAATKITGAVQQAFTDAMSAATPPTNGGSRVH